MMPPSTPITIQYAETTWLETIVHVETQQAPNGMKILLYTLSNGHRYAIPLAGEILRATQRAVSPVAIAGTMPNNSHGT